MTDLTDEAVKALLEMWTRTKYRVMPQNGQAIDLARSLLEARAENARLRADAQAAVALMVEKIAPPDDTAAWAYGEDRRAGYQDAIDDLIALAPVDALAELEALRKERDSFRAVLEGAEYGNVESIATNDVENSRALGQVVKQLTLNCYADRDRLAADLAAAQAQIEALRGAPFPDETGFYGLIGDAMSEAEKAMRKFPQPNYVISKVAEEAGEVVKAAIHCAEGRETAENLRGEMKQLIAMLYRLWVEGDGVHGLPSVRAALAALPAKEGE